MVIETIYMTTKELQQALRDYCAANGGVPMTVIIKSHNREISVDLHPGGMITADEFRHAAFGD